MWGGAVQTYVIQAAKLHTWRLLTQNCVMMSPRVPFLHLERTMHTAVVSTCLRVHVLRALLPDTMFLKPLSPGVTHHLSGCTPRVMHHVEASLQPSCSATSNGDEGPGLARLHDATRGKTQPDISPFSPETDDIFTPEEDCHVENVG